MRHRYFGSTAHFGSTARFGSTALAAVLLLGTPALVSCGDAIQQGAEQIAEGALGGDVDITDEGLTIEGEGGENLALGSDLALPESWPAAVPAFEGGSLSVVSVSAGNANAMWTYEGTGDDALATYRSALESAGYVIETESTIGGLTVMNAAGNGFRIDATIGEVAGQTSVTVTASPQS